MFAPNVMFYARLLVFSHNLHQLCRVDKPLYSTKTCPAMKTICAVPLKFTRTFRRLQKLYPGKQAVCPVVLLAGNKLYVLDMQGSLIIITKHLNLWSQIPNGTSTAERQEFSCTSASLAGESSNKLECPTHQHPQPLETNKKQTQL
jgi:hypothetical protein